MLTQCLAKVIYLHMFSEQPPFFTKACHTRLFFVVFINSLKIYKPINVF